MMAERVEPRRLLYGDNHQRQVVIERIVAERGDFATESFEQVTSGQAHVLASEAGDVVLAEFFATGVSSFG